jgi:serine phosphatase RsbU (regulator of sigma subunit)
MLGITYIHDTILRKETYFTNTVLEIVRERFKRTFKTFGSDSKNGMDIALCALNLDTLVLQYSGANLPLWIVRNGDLIEHKPTRCPIGFYPVDIDFQQNEIQLEKNDTIYMFSDGIYDQLSDINFKKYQKNKFRTLILENTALSMENQKQKILENFENWKGVNYQTDDVTVLGFKI